MVSIVAEIGLTFGLSALETSFTKMHDSSMCWFVIMVMGAYVPVPRTIARWGFRFLPPMSDPPEDEDWCAIDVTCA
jgi:hypothetical protein